MRKKSENDVARIPTAEVMRRLGVKRTTLHRLTKEGLLGQPISYADSPRARLYYAVDVIDSYLAHRAKSSTHEAREAQINEFQIELEAGKRRLAVKRAERASRPRPPLSDQEQAAYYENLYPAPALPAPSPAPAATGCGFSLDLSYEGQQVRMVGTPDRPEWVAADVAKVLGIGQPANVMRNFDDDEKGVYSVHTLGGTQRQLTVTEPGLYRLIFASRKPEAKVFRRWVWHEILPTLRAHGTYPAPRGEQMPNLPAPAAPRAALLPPPLPLDCIPARFRPHAILTNMPLMGSTYPAILSRMKFRREQLGLTCAQMAMALNHPHRAYYHNIETGAMKLSPVELAYIAYLLQCRADWLLRGVGPMPTSRLALTD